jgi:TonB family protein
VRTENIGQEGRVVAVGYVCATCWKARAANPSYFLERMRAKGEYYGRLLEDNPSMRPNYLASQLINGRLDKEEITEEEIEGIIAIFNQTNRNDHHTGPGWYEYACLIRDLANSLGVKMEPLLPPGSDLRRYETGRRSISGSLCPDGVHMYGATNESYLQTVVRRVWHQWANRQVKSKLIQRNKADQSIGVTFTILADGSVTDVELVDPCGDSVLEEAAQSAILDAAPFPPLPKEIGADINGLWSFCWAP